MADVPKALIDWSKWLIAINFSAATGCIIIFDKNALTIKTVTGFYILLAVIFFALAVIISILFTFLLSTQMTEAFQLKNSHYLLGGLQILFFVLAIACLCLWVGNKQPKPPATTTPNALNSNISG